MGVINVIHKVLRKVKDFIGLQMCKSIQKHNFIVAYEPSDMFPTDGRKTMFFNKDGLRYCKYCRHLEMFNYHCLGLNPPQYIVDETNKVDYIGIVGSLVEDPYNLLPEDLQLIKIIKPELYEYCKLYVNKG